MRPFVKNIFKKPTDATHEGNSNHIDKRKFFLNMTKMFVIAVIGFERATSCVRDQDATTVPARDMWDTISLNWAQFMLQWFIRFPEFVEFT